MGGVKHLLPPLWVAGPGGVWGARPWILGGRAGEGVFLRAQTSQGPCGSCAKPRPSVFASTAEPGGTLQGRFSAVSCLL